MPRYVRELDTVFWYDDALVSGSGVTELLFRRAVVMR